MPARVAALSGAAGSSGLLTRRRYEMAIQPRSGGALERQESSSIADVVNTILDKGVVVDIFARVSLVGIELLRVDARVVIASVDTYLRFAEAVGRLEMGKREPKDLTGVVEDVTAAGAKRKTKGTLEEGVDKLEKWLEPDEDEKEEAARRRER
jgi:gas vesicle structural protein